MTQRTQPPAALGVKRALIPSLAILILLLSAALRFHRLGAQSLWYDEGVAHAHALRALPELIPLLQPNVHVPVYFTVLGWWQDLTGSSEFALRSLSALCSIVGVAYAFALGRRLFHPLAGLAAASLVALNSFSIYYAQETRMYAMLTAIAGASMWLFLACLPGQNHGDGGRPGWRNIVGLGLVNALGVYTHVAFALVILTQAALVSLRILSSLLGAPLAWRWTTLSRQPVIRLPLAFVLTLLLFLPWLSVSVLQLGARSHRLQYMPVDQMLREIFSLFAFGATFELNAGALSLVPAILLLFGLLPSPSRRRAWRHTLLPIAWVAISISAYLAVGLGDHFFRLLLPAQLAFALWLGRGVWALWNLRLPALSALARFFAAVALIAYLLTLYGGLDKLYHHPDFQRDDMRGLARRIESDLRAGDGIIVSAAGLQELLRYYYRGEAPVYPLPTGGADDDATRARVLDIIAAHNRLHVIFYGAEQQDPKQIVETTLNRSAFEIDDRWVDDLRYVFYASDQNLGEPTVLSRDFGGEIRLRSVALNTTELAAGDVLRAQLVWTALAPPRKRYKVFLQLLDSEGVLVAQRDSEPAGGSARATTWEPGAPIVDNHGLLMPADLPPGDYRLIAGLYGINDPAARLPVGADTHLEVAIIRVLAGG
ncbi:MAG: glycosyltransferase family 39 protein [Chloroflexi bacterium]|nr:glycosyltransferase family 39 protein [Chloroflexota bacterium]